MAITIFGMGCYKCVELATLTGWLAKARAHKKSRAVA